MEWQLSMIMTGCNRSGSRPTICQAVSRHYTVDFLEWRKQEAGRNSFLDTNHAEVGGREEPFRSGSHICYKRCREPDPLDQLVKVKHTKKEPSAYYRINGSTPSIFLTAEESANQLRLNRQVKETMRQIEAALPAGYEIHASYDATDYIREELHKIYIRSGSPFSSSPFSCC